MAKDKIYVSEIPELLKEWDYEKNLDLRPDQITCGTAYKVWWICPLGHSYQAKIANRVLLKRGCPYCAGKKALPGYNDLCTTNPDVAEEWDYEKNNPLLPSDVTRGCNKKVWWSCKRYHHSWQATICNRTKERGCPFCSGKKVLRGFNDLATTESSIAAEWDYDKNGDLEPTMVSRSCNKTVWWLCKNNHSWQSPINGRSAGHGCPFCTGQKAIIGINDLSTTHPELIKEWNREKNIDIDIRTIMHGSHKQVWWKCSLCGYEWKTSVSNRSKGNGCPLCSNHTTKHGVNDLAMLFPELIEEWDYEKNTDISPDAVYSLSTKKAWWICKKCGRSWRAMIRNRTEKGVGCAVCSGHTCGSGINDLETLFPSIAEEYDTECNMINPSEIAAHAGIKVWWKCRYCGKSWQALVSSRTGKWQTGCPHCNREFHTSFPEQALLHYIEPFYPDAINGYTLKCGKELDIFIPSLRIAIEYDGVAWHTNPKRDERKNEACISESINLIRIRESGLPVLQTPCIIYEISPYDDADLERVLISVLAIELNIPQERIDVDLTRDNMIIQSRYRTMKKDRSLASRFPSIAEEWCYEKNGELTPDKISFGSGTKVWWRCKICGNEWKSDVTNRTCKRRGCPKCRRAAAHEKYMKQMIEKTVTLQEAFPDIAMEWNSEKNGTQTPYNMAAKSGMTVWWKCSRCGNEWSSKICYRTYHGVGCPNCSQLKRRNQRKCRKVICLETQITYNSIAEIERTMGINHACIIACCKGKHLTAGGYHWKYVDDSDNNSK